MQDFCLFINQGWVQVARIQGRELTPISFNGENQVSEEQFVTRFKQKIEYQSGDLISMLVFTDQAEFKPDYEFCFSAAFQKQSDIHYLIEQFKSNYANVLSFPAITEQVADEASEEPNQSAVEIKKEETKPDLDSALNDTDPLLPDPQTQFCLFVDNGFVKVARLQDGKLLLIRFSGEDKITIERFWDTFKNKIEYQREDCLALMIFSDQAQFDIDHDIRIANLFDQVNDLSLLIEKHRPNYPHLLSYPSVDLTQIQHHAKSSTRLKYQAKADEVVDTNTLQSYFRQQTYSYRSN